jgi:Permuted papain-like amidase enzyme, YaeF/YiiX, C92 family
VWANEALSHALIRYLTQEVHNYQRRIPNNLERLKRHIRPGDVLLVEGKSRISQIIKYLTQSSWSHSAIYVGDHIRLTQHGLAEQYRELHGEESRYLLVEAEMDTGVQAVPLTKYLDYNVRLCRPYSLSVEDLEKVLAEVIGHLGDQYDRKQILDLGRYLTPFSLIPARWRRKAFFLGPSSSRAAICSSLIARAFLNVHYPILPLASIDPTEEKKNGIFPYGRRFRSFHPSLALPRDFDLSPYFQIVKFNFAGEGPVDYRSLVWEGVLDSSHTDDSE